MVSIIDAQREIILNTIRQTTRGDWKVLVVDIESRRLIDNVLEEDAILNENITHIEQIEQRKPTNRDVNAIYFLTPQPHIVDCVMADLGKRKYRKAFLVWTSLLHPALRDRIDKSSTAREQIALFKVLNVEFFPRESHLVTFRDPWAFPVLFHPACNGLVRQHMEDVAQKIVGVCVALGEYPIIRYYKPRTPSHEASILCSHLARFVQDELDLYAKFHEDFPPQTGRARGVLIITDRSMDLMAPLLHEFTYQAMVHDLLPIREGDRITYKTVVNEGQPDQSEKELEISEKDKIWVESRHQHMKDIIEKLTADFQKFMNANPNFTKQDDNPASLGAIKDMLAGLPQFQEMKEAYNLHLSMAQESMNRFQRFKLPDVASVEQVLATGLDEDYKKPKGMADQVIRMLDEPSVTPSDRLRLLCLYTLHRSGVLPADLTKLLAHAQLPSQDAYTIQNLSLLGANTSRTLKDSRPVPPALFPTVPPPPGTNLAEEYALSRYQPALHSLLETLSTGSLDPQTFPYTKPPLDMGADSAGLASATSLRAAKPTWARSRTTAGAENRQRCIVFMAGGATYSESRVCYTVGRERGKEVVLVTSHMLTPALFVRQVSDLSAERRQLGLPADAPKQQAPAHLSEPDQVAKPAPAPQRQQAAAPVQAMGAMNLNGGGPAAARPHVPAPAAAPVQANSSAKLQKDPEKKKKHHFFGKKDKA
nr:hypothetical protein B0A51_09808 [Rachicladosporium sp. CCFEE 5018]